MEKIVLFLSAQPNNSALLRVGAELRNIQEAISSTIVIPDLKFQVVAAVRPRDLISSIIDLKPYIVHFSGHGTKTGEICLEEDDGSVHPISKESVVELFSTIGDGIDCVVFNACNSGILAKEVSRLVKYSVGMEYSVSDDTAIQFSIGFYRAVSRGVSIEKSFKLALTEMKMENNKEFAIPKLFSNGIDINSKDVDCFDNDLGIVKKEIYEYLLNDQIIESGGWGYSQIGIMEEATKKKFSLLEREEGGIISTYLALKALLCYLNDEYYFCNCSFSSKALNYFLRRQTGTGGFGRFVSSRSGIEIHPSLRHTAISLSALIDLNGPPGAIIKGLQYINRNYSIEAIRDDASPALAIVSLLHLNDKLRSSNYIGNIFDSNEIKIVNMNQVEKNEHQLLRELLELSRNPESYPLFPPYGKTKELIFETAFTTIDMLPNKFNNEVGEIVLPILKRAIMYFFDEGGLPFNPDITVPDIGITGYFIYIVDKTQIMGKLNDDEKVKWNNALLAMRKFIAKNYKNIQYKTYTHCDTISSLLLLS